MDLFVEGPVDPAAGDTTAHRWRSRPAVGGVAWFAGQVRGDRTDAGAVTAIEYSAYRPMADQELQRVIDEATIASGIDDVFVRHALGLVPVGGVAMLVGVAGAHRGEVFATLAWLVDAIKERVPIYGKEFLDGADHRWKVNT